MAVVDWQLSHFPHHPMTEIILTPEQAAVLSSPEGVVAVRHPDGSFLGWVSLANRYIVPGENPFTPEEVAAAEAEAESEGPWRTTQEVLEYLKSLDEPRS
jgi:hypothetical protein